MRSALAAGRDHRVAKLNPKVNFFKVRGCPLVQQRTLISLHFRWYRRLDFLPLPISRRPQRCVAARMAERRLKLVVMSQTHDVLQKIRWNRMEPPPEPRQSCRSPTEFCHLAWLRRHGTVRNRGWNRPISLKAFANIDDSVSSVFFYLKF